MNTITQLHQQYLLTLRPIKIARSRTTQLTMYAGVGSVYT